MLESIIELLTIIIQSYQDELGINLPYKISAGVWVITLVSLLFETKLQCSPFHTCMVFLAWHHATFPMAILNIMHGMVHYHA